jgi:hypothetical protein
MGLQARSYAAYHPPAAYVVLAPVVLASGGRSLVALYLLRGVSAVTAGAVALVTSQLAADLARRTGRPHRWTVAVAAAAGVTMAALPALADSGGRVNADIYAALLVVLGCRLVLRWVDRPDLATSWWLGALLAVAVLTRETAVVLAIPVIVATAVLLRTDRLDRGIVARALAPPLVASAAWIGWQWVTSGYADGSRAFLERYGHLVAHSPRTVTDTIGDSLLVPYGAWGVPWPLVASIVALALTALVLLARSGERVVAATAAGMLAFAAVALALAVGRGLNVVSARLLLPAYPAVVAAATVGWAALGRPAAGDASAEAPDPTWPARVLAVPVVAFAALFAATGLLARFSPGFG